MDSSLPNAHHESLILLHRYTESERRKLEDSRSLTGTISRLLDTEEPQEPAQPTGSKPLNVQLREFGARVASTLIHDGATVQEAAATRLSIALDAVHKSILMVS